MEISVIIPMYNAEKFIAACLESLLAQTFQDFEVIVADDCSTDNSVAIVEGYAEKFNGRLKLTSTKKNSGGGGYVPRNIGLGLSRGKYIYFADADDFIAERALEILHMAAENYGADVVYLSRYYSYADAEKTFLVTDVAGMRFRKSGIEEKPAVTRDDPSRNLERLLVGDELFHMPWTKFVERRLLVENEISFPKIISGGDFIWTIQVLYCAKKILRLPIALYFYREDAVNSVTRKKRSPQEQISTCAKAFLMGTRTLQDLSEKIPPLKENPKYLHQAMIPFFTNCMQRTSEARSRLNSLQVCEILSSEFPNDSVLPFLFGVLDEQEKILAAKGKG